MGELDGNENALWKSSNAGRANRGGSLFGLAAGVEAESAVIAGARPGSPVKDGSTGTGGHVSLVGEVLKSEKRVCVLLLYFACDYAKV